MHKTFFIIAVIGSLLNSCSESNTEVPAESAGNNTNTPSDSQLDGEAAEHSDSASETDNSDVRPTNPRLAKVRQLKSFDAQAEFLLELYLEDKKSYYGFTKEREAVFNMFDMEEKNGRRMRPIQLGTYDEDDQFVTEKWLYVDSLSLQLYEWDLAEDMLVEHSFK